ncbi:putative outer membrane protein probably involved in nutrient binding [unidentified eubacterium SCB49]|nr:putative outer membrane protein probably involved in nutrient binding [unidentified eubacterium SCB49]
MKTKFSGILALLLVLVVQLSFAQQKTVTGTVNDDSGLPLPGANVVIKGTNTGTQTDFDGNYSISASVGQTLLFTYVGFGDQEIPVTASNVINVDLVPGAALDQVVITGYSRKNQTTQTSAVVSISASEISELSPTTSVDNLLQGKAAGVQVTAANGKPGQGAFVRIRGTGSLTAGASSPLYLVDGAPIREEDLGGIANEDIENITILKDAATTARYGSRGANGVVVITTKGGKRNNDAQVRISSRTGYSERIAPNYDLMNAEQKLQYEAELNALGVNAAGPLPGVTTLPGSEERQFLLDNQTDWSDLILRNGFIQSNNFSVSGGADKVDYFFSAGHDRNTGIIDQLSGYERTNARLNLNIDAKEWLTIGVNVGYSRSSSDEPRDRNNMQNPFRAMADYNPYETEFVLDENGNVTYDESGNPIYSPTTTSFNVRGALLSEPSVDYNNNLLASATAAVRLSDHFTYNFSAALNGLTTRTDGYSKPGGILDSLIGDADNPGNKLDFGSYLSDMTISNSLSYNLNGEKNNLNILGLYEYNIAEARSYTVRSIGFPSALLSTQSNAAQVTDGSTTRSKLALVSYGLFADYDYDERYLASASARYDASSNFGDDEQYGLFYSVSAGWNIAKENFFDVDAVNDFKLRGAYGTVGNRSGISRYASQGTVGFGSYPGGSSTIPDNIANPLLQWETTTTTNVGLELNMFQNRLRFVTDYFIRDTEDLLFDVPRAAESGIFSVTDNLGKIQNKGLELSLSGDIIRGENLTWTVGGNIILLDTEIVELPDGEDVTPNAFNILYREGSKINEHYLVRYAGVDPATGRPQYLNAEGETVFSDEIDGDTDRVLQGKSTIADKEGGFYSNIRYKGFGLRTDFVFKTGNWINDQVQANLNSDGALIGANQATSAFNYWQNPGDTNVHPSPLYIDEVIASDRFLTKGDYLRLRNVTLSYNFDKAVMDKTFLSSLRIYVQGQNLLTFSDFYGDPEVGISSGETISFADSVAPGELTLYSYPNTKSYQIGVDIGL